MLKHSCWPNLTDNSQNTTVQSLLGQGASQLKAAGFDSQNAVADVRVLLAHVLGIERGRLTLLARDNVPSETQAKFQQAVTRRAVRQPVAQIIGQRAFYGLTFQITPDVLDPRPETETLIETACLQPFEHVLDLGVGSGCILLSLLMENPRSLGLGLDVSSKAIEVARANADQLCLTSRATFQESNWCDALMQSHFHNFDLIVSNPPYISKQEMDGLSVDVREFEPHLALTDGGDGLGCYRLICQQAPEFLTLNGRLIFEIGTAQGPSVMQIMSLAGFKDIHLIQDLGGHDRVLVGRYR